MKIARLPVDKEKEVARLHLSGEYSTREITSMCGVSQSTVCRIIKMNNLSNQLDDIPNYQDAVQLYLIGRTRREIRIATYINFAQQRYIERKYGDEKKRRMEAIRSNKTCRTNPIGPDGKRLRGRPRKADQGC